jgi:asparagine synthetase B (glutamine-hydrolysing)
LADVHEKKIYNYFLVQAPVHYLHFNTTPGWDETLQELIEKISRSCSEDYAHTGYKERMTIRQLLFVNSHRWAAKALSVSESLGLRVLYPYIWRDILLEQGKIPWSAKVHNGIVKWPLKRLLEDFMPSDFIYRKKSGFVPPLVHWLTDPAFNHKARDIVARRSAFVSEVLPFQVLDRLFSDALNGKRLRTPLLNTLWGAIFTESWLQEYSRGTTKP